MKHKCINLTFCSIVLTTLVFYIPGLILFPFFIDYYGKYYALSVVPHKPFLIIFVIFTLQTYFLSNLVITLPRFSVRKISASLIYYLVLFLSLVFLIASANFALSDQRSFRHVSRLADASFLTSLTFILLPILLIYIAKCAIYVSTGKCLGKKNKAILLILLLSLFLSLNSASGIFNIAITACIIFYPNLLQKKLSEIKVIGFLRYFFVGSIVLFFALLGGI